MRYTLQDKQQCLYIYPADEKERWMVRRMCLKYPKIVAKTLSGCKIIYDKQPFNRYDLLDTFYYMMEIIEREWRQ